jgi:hypothetical protein
MRLKETSLCSPAQSARLAKRPSWRRTQSPEKACSRSPKNRTESQAGFLTSGCSRRKKQIAEKRQMQRLSVSKIRRLGDAGMEQVVAAYSNAPGKSWGIETALQLEVLHEAIGALLAGWPLEDIEEAAWTFALDGWQRVPPLVAEYDIAFHKYYIPLLEKYRLRNPSEVGLSSLGILFDEFRNRVQFLQTRAADIRLSAQLDRLVDAAFDRIEGTLDSLIAMQQSSDSQVAIAEFERAGKGDLLLALANRVGRHAPEVGGAFASVKNERVFEKLKAIHAGLAMGVAGNLLTSAITTLYEYLAQS